ncbi:HpcH/HpaI aldolase/citrate lyase family protein [Amycolatopsis alkalitolerans]|uniref:CoA ester lyase n=1 Tax=Amycolatopsis alkalitolerans TaxID=2547244 RepID=A0A5C4M900_9PSEU|nr:CoA ester lyase [Amycolatopsis alkalitolerans]TNC29078.1 CoA ester lyase [Amycolatopsis alkalitolerans]
MALDFERMVAARALLFVPGHRADRFDKAVASGADAVILDLEDAVAAADKDAARSHVDEWLSGGGTALVRINGSDTPEFEPDLELVAKHGCPVMLPKAEDPRVLARIEAPLLPIIETARGIEAATALCAVENVARVAFGSVDLATQLGVRHDDELALGYARSRLVLASAANGIAPPIDGVTTDLTGESALTADVRHARRLGFGGKLCIHPRQVPLVREGFAPTEEELSWARRVLAAGDSVSAVDGQMVDRPVLERARRLLARQ